jgi:hypothetical protein
MADTLKEWIKKLGTDVYIPLLFEPVKIKADEVTAFTGRAPFQISQWDEKLEDSAIVTFVSRTDRMWSPDFSKLNIHRKLRNIIRFDEIRLRLENRIQNRRIIQLSSLLKKRFKRVKINVIGQGDPIVNDLFEDLRTQKFSRDYEEKMIKVCAESHVVVGTHGSHMILPSSVSGASIHIHNDNFEFHDLLDCIVTEENPRLAVIRHQRYPVSSSSPFIAKKITKLLINMSIHKLIFMDNFTNPGEKGLEERTLRFRAQRARALGSQDKGGWGQLLYDCSCYFNK